MNNNPKILPIFPCYSCQGTKFRYLPFGYHFRGNALRAVKCLTCGLIFIHPQPSAEEIAEMYSEAYFTSADINIRPHGRGEYLQSVISKGEIQAYKRRLKTLGGFIGKGRLLEIGCGPGHFLKFAQNSGWEVKGIEISDFAARYAREKFGLDVRTDSIESADLKDQFEVVFMGDLLEHLANPLQGLIRVRNILSPNGFIIIEVPAVTNGLYSRLGTLLMNALGKVKYINLPPYHLFEFTPRSIRFLLECLGFKLLYLRQSTVKPGDIGLRDSKAINAIKMIAQWMNYLLTGITGCGGDRLMIIAQPKNKAQKPLIQKLRRKQ